MKLKNDLSPNGAEFDSVEFLEDKDDNTNNVNQGSKDNLSPIPFMRKSEIIEEDWLDFLLYIKGRTTTTKSSDGLHISYVQRPFEPVEEDFWSWYLQEKL